MTKAPGAKIDGVNLKSMKDSLLPFLLFFASPLAASPGREGIALQELRLNCEEFSQKLSHQKVELEILSEKLQSLDSSVSALRQELAQSGKAEKDLAKDRLSVVEKRLSSLEKSQETLVGDLKILKNHFNESAQSLTACQTQLTQLEKQLSQDIKSLKGSLQSMVALLQKGETLSDKVYVVKPGDSLGKIALENKTSQKTLKELNQLSTDRIYVGQKLQLP